MQMNTEESRRQFEAWCKQRGYTEKYYFFRQTHPNHYDDDQIEEMWMAWTMAWQASHANMPKIKLPGVNFYSTFYVDIENRVINKCKQAIHEAGYEVE
jgi:hypothetical protein